MTGRVLDGPAAEARLDQAARALGAGEVEAAVAALDGIQVPAALEPAVLGLLGHAKHRMGDVQGALAALGRGRSLAPEDPGLANAYGLALLAAGRAEAGLAQLRDAVRLSSSPEPRENLIGVLEQLGRRAEAIGELRALAHERPGDAGLLNRLGNLLRDEGELQASEQALRDALRARPDHRAARNNLGLTLQAAGALDEAEACFRQVLDEDPQDIYACSNLCGLLERTHRLEEAAAVAEALAERPEIALVVARCDRRLGRAERARDRMRAALAGEVHGRLRASLCFELGRCLEQLGEDRAALAAFSEGNALMDAAWRARQPGEDPQLALFERSRAVFAATSVQGWSATPQPSATPAFLVGFPRSGTTLLEQMLDAHPEVHAIPERPLLEPLIAELGSAGLYPEGLPELEPARIAELQARFLAAARAEVGVEDGLVLHKMPLDSARLGFIYRLFPDAPILLSLRHPADVVLSCFMQQFEPNHAMAHFHDLERAARHYDRVMDLVDLYRERLPLNLLEVRYEALIEDPEAVLRGVAEHLGVSFQPTMLDHAAHARRRGRIETPSYHQVSEGLHGKARGRWRRYEQALAPAMVHLQRWIARYGYAEDQG